MNARLVIRWDKRHLEKNPSFQKNLATVTEKLDEVAVNPCAKTPCVEKLTVMEIFVAGIEPIQAEPCQIGGSDRLISC